MSDLDLTVTITGGDLSDLVLTRANGYLNLRGGLGPGARLWRRQTAESPFVDGRILIGRTLEMETATLQVLVVGSSSADLTAKMTSLLDRMEQPSFVLQVAIDGITYRWQCECADSAPGDAGAFDAVGLMQYQQALRFVIPRHPVPLAGPL